MKSLFKFFSSILKYLSSRVSLLKNLPSQYGLLKNLSINFMNLFLFPKIMTNPYSSKNNQNVSSKKSPTILKNKKGQATVEYILVLAFVLFFAGKASKSIIGMLDTGILKVGGRLEKQLKTGRAQLNTWKN